MAGSGLLAGTPCPSSWAPIRHDSGHPGFQAKGRVDVFTASKDMACCPFCGSGAGSQVMGTVGGWPVKHPGSAVVSVLCLETGGLSLAHRTARQVLGTAERDTFSLEGL